MTLKQIARILEAHYINYTIENNRIIATDSYTLNGAYYEDKVDLTNINEQKLFDWLGY